MIHRDGFGLFFQPIEKRRRRRIVGEDVFQTSHDRSSTQVVPVGGADIAVGLQRKTGRGRGPSDAHFARR